MAKIYPEMVAIGRPARLEPAMRCAAAREANRFCCLMLNAMVDERFPDRVAFPGDLAARVVELREAFFEEAAFLFELAACRDVPEEPTQSVCGAFAALLGNDAIHNVRGGHEPWREWHTVHFGDDEIFRLFDQEHADAANPGNDPDIASVFFRAHELLKRINAIALHSEDPVSISIMDIMPEAVRLSLEGSRLPPEETRPALEGVAEYQKLAFERPWMMVSEQYVVYRYRVADELGVSDKTLSNYEKDGKTSKGTFWPSPLNPGNTHGKKYYDPLKVLDALTLLPKDFGKHTKVDDIIAKLMNNQLSSKIVPRAPRKPKKETAEEELAREAGAMGWQKEYSVWDASTMSQTNRPE